MTLASIRPSNVGGIKQLAKKISHERGITYTKALDEASRQAGYENFVHARRQIKKQPGLDPASVHLFPVYLSAHWQGPHRNADGTKAAGPRYGREVLRIDLARPLPAIVARHRVQRARALSGFRAEYADHLEHRTDLHGQKAARDALAAAARCLRFMEATGLQPVSTQRCRDALRPLSDLPGRAHVIQWFDPVTLECILFDEPYAGTLPHHAAKRLKWLENEGMHEIPLRWEGLCLPGECAPRLVGPDEHVLRRIAANVDVIVPVGDTRLLAFETGSYGDDFVSPQRQIARTPRRPRPGPSWKNHKGAAPYGGAPGIRSRWRPAKSMPLELHKKLGPVLQRLSSGGSWAVNDRLRVVRSNLEEWVIKEHGIEHPNLVHEIYYDGPTHSFYRAGDERLGALKQSRSIVERGYDDCKPRRELLAALDEAIADVSTAHSSDRSKLR